MALFTDLFDGAADTMLSSRPGWTLSTSGWADYLKINGTGAVKLAAGGDGKAATHDTGSIDHYFKVVIGQGFVDSAQTVFIGASAINRSAKFTLGYDTAASTIRLRGLRDGSSQSMGSVSQVLVAGDELLLEQEGSANKFRIKLNGTLIYDNADSSYFNDTPQTSVGLFPSYDGAASGINDVFRSVEANTLAGASDTENPGLTGALTAVSKTSSSISVTGPTATDNVGVAAYEFSQDGGATWPFSETTPAHVYTGLTPLTSYDLRMRAKDAAGNASPALSLTTSTYRAGALGSTILLTTGPVDGNPAGILYNDVVPGTDDAKWFSFRIIDQTLNGGTLDIDPDGTFEFTGAASGSFTYQLEVDGVDVGSPQLVTLYDQTTYRPSGDVTTTGWTSTGANFYDQINESPSNDASYVTSPALNASPGPLVMDIAAIPAGLKIARFIARRTDATGELRQVFLDAANAEVGATAWVPLTSTSFALYEPEVTLTATAVKVKIEVRA